MVEPEGRGRARTWISRTELTAGSSPRNAVSEGAVVSHRQRAFQAFRRLGGNTGFAPAKERLASDLARLNSPLGMVGEETTTRSEVIVKLSRKTAVRIVKSWLIGKVFSSVEKGESLSIFRSGGLGLPNE